MNGEWHLAAMVGDHRGGPLSDVAPDRDPVTFFASDGKVWMVLDVRKRWLRAYRRIAKREGVSVDELLSATVVAKLTEVVERWQGFE